MTAKVVFILDKSGSMSGLTSSTIEGYNNFIKEAKVSMPDAKLTTILFNQSYSVIVEDKTMTEVSQITYKEYHADGMTALLDAMGKAISMTEKSVLLSPEVVEKVIFVITTDGEENSSREYSRQTIKDMVEYSRNSYGWEFLFLGANIDAFSAGQSLGILNTSQYTANDIGTQSLYRGVTNTVSGYINTGKVDDDWNKDIK
jgi:uncharacterized protein YegL